MRRRRAASAAATSGASQAQPVDGVRWPGVAQAQLDFFEESSGSLSLSLSPVRSLSLGGLAEGAAEGAVAAAAAAPQRFLVSQLYCSGHRAPRLAQRPPTTVRENV